MLARYTTQLPRLSLAAVLAGSLLLPALARADVTYQEVTQITGGSAVGMLKMVGAFNSQARQLNGPMTVRVMIHGSRMVRSGVHLTQIIDLNKQTITSVETISTLIPLLPFYKWNSS